MDIEKLRYGTLAYVYPHTPLGKRKACIVERYDQFTKHYIVTIVEDPKFPEVIRVHPDRLCKMTEDEKAYFLFIKG